MDQLFLLVSAIERVGFGDGCTSWLELRNDDDSPKLGFVLSQPYYSGNM
jgi:hypothetical protein